MEPGKKRSRLHRVIIVYLTWTLCAFHLTWIILFGPNTAWVRVIELLLSDGIFLSAVLGYLHYSVKGDNVLADVIKATINGSSVPPSAP